MSENFITVPDPNEQVLHRVYTDRSGERHRIQVIDTTHWSCGDIELKIRCSCGGAFARIISFGCPHDHLSKQVGVQLMDAFHWGLMMVDLDPGKQHVFDAEGWGRAISKFS